MYTARLSRLVTEKHVGEQNKNELNIVVLSKSEDSSPLIVINTILKDVKFNKKYHQFNMNGSHIIIITPSIPIYNTEDYLYTVCILMNSLK